MSFNTFGHLFRVTTWGESHGPAIGATVDGCPPGVALAEADLQPWLDARKPGQNKFTTQRREDDLVRILSGVFEGRTTGTPIQLMIENTDQRSKDYGDIAQSFRPGHADITYHQKYGLRDYRGGGRSSARETASRVAAGGVARAVLARAGAGASHHRLHGADGRPRDRPRALRRRPRSRRTRSGAPIPSRRRTGQTISMTCASRTTRSVPSSRSWPKACQPVLAHRFTPSSIQTWPAR